MGQVYGDRWEIQKSLPEGGQAHTFLVADKKGDGKAQYVLKRLKNIDRVERFKGEIEAIRNLSHENIVRLIDFDLEAKKPYLVTEYCPGGSLFQAEPFWQESPARAFEIFQQICEAVAHAHLRDPPVIHRDLKPQNIFLRTKEGPAVVGDFGLCYFEREGERITRIDEAVGPRLFIAPEHEDGRIESVRRPSDIYSLGKLLYWLLSGGSVFSREKHRQKKWDLKDANADSPTGWNNIYMEHVNRLLDLMIVDNPKERADIGKILYLSRKVARAVHKEFNPVSMQIKQPCTYCGYGYYVLKAESGIEGRKFGFEGVGDPGWRIFACNSCGHVQAFRIEYAKEKQWWDRETNR